MHQFVNGDYVLAGNNERVTFTDRVRITDGQGVLRFNPEPLGLDEAKRADSQTKRITPRALMLRQEQRRLREVS
jgi:hypothetical protein